MFNENVTYDQIAQAFHEEMSRTTTKAIENELPEAYLRPLDDISRDAVEGTASRRLQLAEAIEAVIQRGVTHLPYDQQLDLELAAKALRAQHAEAMDDIGGSPRHTVLPSALSTVANDLLFQCERDPRLEGNATERRRVVQGFEERLQQFPTYLQQELARLDRPVATWAGLELSVVEAFPIISNAIRSLAAAVDYKRSRKLGEAIQTAEAAVAAYGGKLKEMPKRTQLSIGPEATQKLLEYKGIDMPLERIHALAMDQLAETKARLDELRPILEERHHVVGFDNAPTIYTFANRLKGMYQCQPGTVRETAEKYAAKAATFAYNHNLIKRLENEKLEIIDTPEYYRAFISVAAMAAPGHFVQGVPRSTFLVAINPTVHREFGHLTIPGTAGHELTPGHHYQFSRATEHPSLVRAWTTSMDLSEGWTTRVAEEVMADLGYCGNEELKLEEEYMAKVDLLRLGGRVCFQSFLLTGNRKYLENPLGIEAASEDPVEAATQLYCGITGFDANRGGGDVNMFSSFSTYALCYLFGNNGFKEMEAAAKAKQGGQYSQFALYEAILQQGNMPLSFVRKALQHDGVL